MIHLFQMMKAQEKRLFLARRCRKISYNYFKRDDYVTESSRIFGEINGAGIGNDSSSLTVTQLFLC